MSIFNKLKSEIEKGGFITVVECDDVDITLCIDGVNFSISSESFDPQCGSQLTIDITDEIGEIIK